MISHVANDSGFCEASGWLTLYGVQERFHVSLSDSPAISMQVSLKKQISVCDQTRTRVLNPWNKHSILLDSVFNFATGCLSPTGLIAQRINVYRGMGSYKPAAEQTAEADRDATVSCAAFCFDLNLDINLN